MNKALKIAYLNYISVAYANKVKRNVNRLMCGIFRLPGPSEASFYEASFCQVASVVSLSCLTSLRPQLISQKDPSDGPGRRKTFRLTL